MQQKTLAMAVDQGAGFEQYRRPTRRDLFLKNMNEIVPWQQLCEVVEPHYPKGQGGRPTIGLERMLRMHFVQHWFKATLKKPLIFGPNRQLNAWRSTMQQLCEFQWFFAPSGLIDGPFDPFFAPTGAPVP